MFILEVRYYAIESVAFWNIVSIQFIQSFTKVYHQSAGSALDNTSLQGETDNFPSCVSKCYYCWCCSHRDRSVFPFFRVENTNNTGQNLSSFILVFYNGVSLHVPGRFPAQRQTREPILTPMVSLLYSHYTVQSATTS